MRINFSGTYRQVERLFNAQAEPVSRPEAIGGFAQTLADISGQQSGKTQQTVPVRETIPPAPPDLMASLKFDRPSLKAAPITPFRAEELLPEMVKESAQSVKTPAGLSAKRIQIRDSAGYLERMKQVEQIVQQVGRATGIDPALGMAVAKAESSFNPKAISSDGHASKGLFQLLDSTGKELHQETGSQLRYDPYDPHLNTSLGVRYLRRLHDIFSTNTKLPADLESVPAANSSSLEKLAVAAFNAGEGRVASAQARAKTAGLNPGIYDQVEQYLPRTTQEYVAKVMQFKQQFGSDALG